MDKVSICEYIYSIGSADFVMWKCRVDIEHASDSGQTKLHGNRKSPNWRSVEKDKFDVGQTDAGQAMEVRHPLGLPSTMTTN